MINIILAEAALETVPEELSSHPSVSKTAERRGKDPTSTLLDISYHYNAMKGMRDWEKRGRPDITHVVLLNLLESPLSKEGRLRVYVHTVKNFVIYIDPEVNLPRNCNRFQGLVEQLFELGKVPPRGKPLMTLGKATLKELVEKIGPSRTFLLTEKGRKTKGKEFGAKIIKEDRPVIIIGGFQRGELRNIDVKLADEKIALYKKPLDAWIIAAIVAQEIASSLGIA
jgi:rRNA small subunit pseudouridine methyltransferase Nep1